MDELAEGTMLADRYRLGPVVGHGAMGQVQLAEDTRLARPVAVKSLRPELARYPDVRRRFGHEARAAARINHPNVVRVYDSGEQGVIPYLVMECLPGSTLMDELAWGPLELPRARRVGLDVLGALDAAHRLGVVHRDVKPGNILLSATLDGPVKVGDFGIAKSAEDPSLASLTDSGSLVGTAAYLAPERVAGGPAGPPSDLYSLGVVLYEALAGRRPYQADTTLAVALAIHMGGAPGLLELRPDLDPAFAAIVERAIARDPADRWASAAEMAESLHRWRSRPVNPSAGGGAPVGSLAAAGLAAGAATEIITGGPPEAGAALSAADAPTETIAGGPPETIADGSPQAGGGPFAAGYGADPAGQVTMPVVRAGAGAGRDSPDSPDGREARASRRRTGVVALACAGAAGVLLAVVVLGTASRRSRQPDAPAITATTRAEAVAGPSTSAVPEESTVAPARSVVPPTTRTTRRPATPTTAARPPSTRATTTTAPAATTTRPTPTTAPDVTTPTTPPTTDAVPSA